VPELWSQTTAGDGSTLSVAVGIVKETAAAPSALAASSVTVKGQVMTGGVMSWTVMKKLHDAELELLSVAVHVT